MCSVRRGCAGRQLPDRQHSTCGPTSRRYCLCSGKYLSHSADCFSPPGSGSERLLADVLPRAGQELQAQTRTSCREGSRGAWSFSPHDRSHEEVMLLLPSKVRTSLESALGPLFLHVQSAGGSRDAWMSLASSSDCGHCPGVSTVSPVGMSVSIASSSTQGPSTDSEMVFEHSSPATGCYVTETGKTDCFFNDTAK